MPQQVQYHVTVYGRVQGVFFRAETKREADRLTITGWVRNLADGSVEAVIQGEKNNIDRMITWLKQGPPQSRVDEVRLEKSDSCSDFTAFDITG